MNEFNSSAITLTSLVLLKRQIDSGKDYYDYLVPFIEQIFIEEPNDAFGADEIQAFLESDFGLKIPQLVVDFVLMRMKRKHYLKDISSKFSKGEHFNGRDIAPQKQISLSQIGDVQQALVKYAISLGRDNFSEESATDAIQKFLKKFQIECIQSYVQDNALPDLPQTEYWEEGLVGLFVAEIIETNFALFEKFMVLVQGNMLANALLSNDTSTPPDTFRKTTFYFDTPNLLHALGYSGEDKQKLVNEMIILLKRLDGRIAVFAHNIEEAEGVVDAVANNIDNLKYAHKPLNIVARENGWKKSEMIQRKEALENDAIKLGFEIKRTPSQSNALHIDEEGLQSLLNAGDAYDQDNVRRMNYDIKSIKSIYVLRKGSSRHDTSPRRIEDCNAILVTSNSVLVQAAYNFTKQLKGEAGYSSVIGTFSLTNIAWLKAPNFARNLIDAQTMAHAYSAMRLSRTELQQVIDNVEGLVVEGEESHDNLQLLRSSTNVERELAMAKAGGENLQDNETISAVIGRVRSTYSAETDITKQKLKEEIEAHKKTQQQLREVHERENKRRDKRSFRCTKIRQILSCFIVILGIFIALLFAYSYLFPVYDWMNGTVNVGVKLATIYFAMGIIWTTLTCVGWVPSMPRSWISKLFDCYCNNKNQ